MTWPPKILAQFVKDSLKYTLKAHLLKTKPTLKAFLAVNQTRERSGIVKDWTPRKKQIGRQRD